MALPPDDASARSFGLEFDGVLITNLVEVSGLKVGKGNLDFAAVRRVAKSDALDAWFKTPTAKDVVVIFFDFEGISVKRYSVTAARPKTLEINGVLSGDNSLLTETFVFTYKECKLA